jgi:hypothetical protein
MNVSELGNWVRNWVHYDNLALGLNRQTANARKLRDEYEGKIIGHLQSNSMENAVIQIAGGRLTVNEERHSQPLTLTRLEEILRGYYASKGATGPMDETADIMKYLRKQRGFETSKRLKKTTVAPLPPLPAAPTSGPISALPPAPLPGLPLPPH